MFGIKLFGICALATNNKATVNTVGTKSIGTTTFSGGVTEAPVFGRRQALQNILGVAAAGAVVATTPSIASALDMDAFMNSELENDKKNCDPKKDPKCAPKLSQDEALCQYGQGGTAKAEACKRVKAKGGTLPTVTKEKSLGGAYAI